MIVEDQESVRGFAAAILRRHGHIVLEASTSAEALQLAQNHSEPIHLLLSDVLLPGIPARELTDRISNLRPGIHVLYLSGHTEDTIVQQGILDPGVHLLSKPFTPDELIRRVESALSSQPR